MEAHVLPALSARRLVGVTPAEIAMLLAQVGAAACADVANQLRATTGERFADAVVPRKLIDIDEGILARATDSLGVATMKEAVNRAMGEVVLLAERRAHADRLAGIDGLDLDDDQIMSGPWR